MGCAFFTLWSWYMMTYMPAAPSGAPERVVVIILIWSILSSSHLFTASSDASPGVIVKDFILYMFCVFIKVSEKKDVFYYLRYLYKANILHFLCIIAVMIPGMKRVLFILLFLPIYCVAQLNPRDFHAFDTDKQLVFIDEFDKRNVNKWHDIDGEPIRVDKRKNFDSGAFHFNGFKKGFNAYGCIVPFDYKSNYEIEIRAKVKLHGRKPERYSGIMFWARPSYKSFAGNYLYINGNGEISIYTLTHEAIDKNDCQEPLLKTVSDFRADEYNTYTVRKYSKWYYVFVNGIYLMAYPHIDIDGQSIGLGGDKGARVSYDYIKMSYLP
jgi:hypothetical protein